MRTEDRLAADPRAEAHTPAADGQGVEPGGLEADGPGEEPDNQPA